MKTKYCKYCRKHKPEAEVIGAGRAARCVSCRALASAAVMKIKETTHDKSATFI